MRVAIRDDDLCAWSDYRAFQKIYDELSVPVSASVIPFAVANHGDFMPYGAYPKNIEKCVSENNNLVKSLQSDIQQKKVEVLLHGYSHEYSPALIPEMCWKPKNRLRKEIQRGKTVLEDLFGPISVFVAPSQGMNAAAMDVLEEFKLNYSGSPNRLRERHICAHHVFNVLKRHLERLLYGRPCSVFKYPKHVEVPICALQDIGQMKRYYKTCKRHHWNLVVVVHYWQLAQDAEKMNQLRDFIHFAKDDGLRFSFVSECFQSR